jgi:hypothetical protein
VEVPGVSLVTNADFYRELAEEKRAKRALIFDEEV